MDVAEIVACMHANADRARRTVETLLTSLPAKRAASPADAALDHSVITAPEARDRAEIAKLAAISPRLLG